MPDATDPIPADSIPAGDLTPGTVGRAGPWAVVNRAGDVSAVSRRCRHQLADLSKGSLDADGCLVCPWHGSRYDVDTGVMVAGPKGFLGYVGKTPGYTQLILATGRALKLRRRSMSRRGDRYVVDPE